MRIIRFDNKGWRTRFDEGFDEENLSRVADAFGFMWSDAYPGSTIYVGYDTRFNMRQLAGVVAGVLASCGLRTVVSDTWCPTPALGWSVAQDEHAVGGVMLTASSASSEYGGISARAADGGPVADEFYDAATRIVSSTAIDKRAAFETMDIMTPYLNALRARSDVRLIEEARLNVVVDPLYGSGRGHLAKLLRSVGCRVHEVHGEELPDFGGLHPLPQEPWAGQCEHAVRSFGCDVGIMLDGDGDRMGVVDETGRYVTPHRTAPLIMEHLVQDRGLQGRIVATFSSSACIRRQAERLACEFTAVPMGFTRIYREFVEGDVLMGVEEFGGVCLPDHMPERDGLLAALMIVEHLACRKQSASSLVAKLEQKLGSMHYVRRDIRLDAASIQAFRNILPGLNLSEVCGMSPVMVSHSDGLYLRFVDDSWVQLRPSRTEPLVRACAESSVEARANALGEVACDKALRLLPSPRTGRL